MHACKLREQDRLQQWRMLNLSLAALVATALSADAERRRLVRVEFLRLSYISCMLNVHEPVPQADLVTTASVEHESS